MDWDEMARPWLEASPDLEKALQPVLQALLPAANLAHGETVLDVGCGTGPSLLAAAEAVGETGRITGIDVAPPLLARAAERVPANVELINGDAGAHAYEEAAFDVVMANFGIMFFEDNLAAFSNLRRAVRPGGRLAATVWGLPADNPWFSMPRKIIDETVADVPRPDPAGPGPMRFGDPAILEGILKQSGWTPEIKTLDIHLTPPGPAEQVAALHMLVTAGMTLRGVETTDEQLERIEQAIIEASREHDVDGHIRVPARIHVVTALAA